MDEREIVASNVRDDAALAFYRTLMHFNGASNTIMFVATMWLLVTKTPAAMKAYRWYLMNLSVSPPGTAWSNTEWHGDVL
ncbi:hypothetical protein AAVH_20345 [Aphelenchoides avenae]|nr:hypothetical protein AAVH_20345 [Aphelenchus avenae]